MWRRGKEERASTANEREVLERIRNAVRSGEVLEVPSVKYMEWRKFMLEVDEVESVMHNQVSDGMAATEFNKLLYARPYVVPSQHGLMNRKKGIVKKKDGIGGINEFLRLILKPL